jgi:hypothetical protein
MASVKDTQDQLHPPAKLNYPPLSNGSYDGQGCNVFEKGTWFAGK